MELASLQPVTVAECGTSIGDDGKPMLRRDGSPVRFVAFAELVAEGRPHRFFCPAEYTGELPAVGQVVLVQLALDMKAKARADRRGDARVVYDLRGRFTGWSKP